MVLSPVSYTHLDVYKRQPWVGASTLKETTSLGDRCNHPPVVIPALCATSCTPSCHLSVDLPTVLLSSGSHSNKCFIVSWCPSLQILWTFHRRPGRFHRDDYFRAVSSVFCHGPMDFIVAATFCEVTTHKKIS